MSGDPRKRPSGVPHPSTKRGAAQVAKWEAEQAEKAREAELRETAAELRSKLERYPTHLPRLLDISGIRQLHDQRFLMRTIQSTPRLRKKREAIDKAIADQHHGPHRPRKGGDTIAAYMNFTLSAHVDIEPWWAKVDVSLWREWLFEFDNDEGPPYARLYSRFAELENFWEELRDLAEEAIRICAERDPRIGQLTTLDGTEQITTAALYHVCTIEECPTGRGGENVAGAYGKQPRDMKLSSDDATECRHDAEDHRIPEDHEHLVRDEALRDLLAGKIDDAYIVPAEGRKPERLRFRTSSGHWWETRDRFAGVRYYAAKNGGRGKFWHGRLQVKLTDHFTGAPICIIDIPAGTNESKALKPMVTRACDVLDRPPLGLSTDSAHWFDETSNWLARRGCQHIGGDRRNALEPELVDDLGGVHCEHCNGLAPQQSYSDKQYPVGKYLCQHQLADDCGGEFRVAVSHAPRRLGPIPASRPEYHYMDLCHSNLENVNRTHRRRYHTAQKHYDHAPKRVSRFVQTLRAQMGLLIEWLRIGLRLGYLEMPDFKHLYLDQAAVYMDLVDRAEAKLDEREKRGMDLPFGPKAAELGIGPPGHPPPLKT